MKAAFVFPMAHDFGGFRACAGCIFSLLSHAVLPLGKLSIGKRWPVFVLFNPTLIPGNHTVCAS